MRKSLMMAAAIAGLTAGFAAAGDVVIPEDDTPFTIQEGDLVRILVKGIAGTQVKVIKVTGPAKATVQDLSYRRGGKPVIGPGNHDVEVKPSGKGEVMVDIEVSPPNEPVKVVKKYAFKVE